MYCAVRLITFGINVSWQIIVESAVDAIVSACNLAVVHGQLVEPVNDVESETAPVVGLIKKISSFSLLNTKIYCSSSENTKALLSFQEHWMYLLY